VTVQLGAVGFESKDPAVWSNLLVDLLGLVPADRPGCFRMDGHAWRFEVVEGPADDLAWVAWEMDDDELDAAVARARVDGVAVSEADPAERDARRRFVLVDPAGIPTELVTGLRRAGTPFASPIVPAGFVADELGLGHVVLSTRDKAESVAFYQRLLGIKLSDHIVCTYFGHAVDLSFFHTNARHHSVAFGGPQKKRLNHFMIQAQEMNDVGLAFDRCLQAGVRIHQTPGRHPNDEMFSFYARAPGGFQFEFGWGARLVDDTTWAPVTWDRISDWGHHPPAMLAGGSPR
jgi:2,3-dihydroxybiphenyl 1,2-dioxygenase